MYEIQKAEYINYEIWILTFGGGFQRAGVYVANVADSTKSVFRMAIRNKINKIVKNKYKTVSVSSSAHIKTLIDIKKWIDESYSHILADGEIKFGIVQKIMNLYLKYQWCLGLVSMPPHCPFDRIIITKMNPPNPPTWTKMNSVEEYKRLVSKALELAGDKSIAEWELEEFSRR